MFIQGHGVMGKLEHVQPFLWKVAWSNSNVQDGWLCQGDDCEEVLYGKYGQFMYLVFMFVVDFCLFH